jgi:hypothetical protein
MLPAIADSAQAPHAAAGQMRAGSDHVYQVRRSRRSLAVSRAQEALTDNELTWKSSSTPPVLDISNPYLNPMSWTPAGSCP